MRNDFEDALAAVQKEVWHTATIEIPNLKAAINESLGGVDINTLEGRVSSIEAIVSAEPMLLSNNTTSSSSLITIFDFNNSDEDINKGFSTYIKPSETIAADFSQYRKIIIQIKATSSANVCAFEIPINESGKVQNISLMFASTRQGWSEIFLQLSADKQFLTFSACSHFSVESSNGEASVKYQNSTTTSYGAIEKIEGYLK